MRVADSFLGNVSEDTSLAARVEREDAPTVAVDDTQRRRSRFRTTADDGTDLGVVVGRDLRAGDVLSAGDSLFVVALDRIEAMVLDFSTVDGGSRAATAAIELGHAVGNRHRDLAVDGDRAYLPLADSRERLEAEVRPRLPDGATVGYDEVSPTLFDDGGGDHGHEHADGHGDIHSHGTDGHVHGVRELDPEDQS